MKNRIFKALALTVVVRAAWSEIEHRKQEKLERRVEA